MPKKNNVEIFKLLISIVKKKLIEDGNLLSTEEQNNDKLIQIGSVEIGSELRKVMPAIESRDRKMRDLRDLVGKSFYTYIKKGRRSQAKEDEYSIGSSTLEPLFQLAEEQDDEIINKALKRRWRSLSLLSIYAGYIGWKGFYLDKQITIQAYLNDEKTKEPNISIESTVRPRKVQQGTKAKVGLLFKLWKNLNRRLRSLIIVLAALVTILANKDVIFDFFNSRSHDIMENVSNEKKNNHDIFDIKQGKIDEGSFVILILDILKDDSIKSLRDDLVSTLNNELNPDLNIVVRSSNNVVDISNGIKNAHELARKIGIEQNAKIVIWGNLIPDKDKFHARFTIVENHPNNVLQKEITLDPVSIKEFDLPDNIISQPIIITSFLVGHSSLYDSKYLSAVKYFEEVLQNTKSKALKEITKLHLGFAYSKLNQKNKNEMFYDKALSLFSDVINSDNFPKSSAYLNRGALYANNGHYNKAINDFNRAEKLFAEDFDTYFNRAFVYIKLEKFEDAKKDLIRAISLRQNSSKAYSFLGFVYQEQHMFAEAIEAHNKAVELNQNSAIALLNRSTFYKEVRQDYNRALLDINNAIKIDNKLPDGFIFRSQIYRKMNLFDKAIADMKKAINLDSNREDLYSKLSEIYLDANNHDSALKYINKSIAIDPSNANYYSLRGRIYFKASKRYNLPIDSAIVNHKRAISIDSNIPEYYFNTGVAFFKKGLNQSNIDSAILYFSGAIEQGFENPDCYNQRGLMNFFNGELNSAIKDFNSAINNDSNNNSYYFNRAKAYLHLKDSANAFKDIERANLLEKSYSPPYFYLGLKMFLNSNQNLAIKYFKSFIRSLKVVEHHGNPLPSENLPYSISFMVQYQTWKEPLVNIYDEPVIATLLLSDLLDRTGKPQESHELLEAGLGYLKDYTYDFNWVNDVFEKKLKPDDQIKTIEKENPLKLQNTYFIIGMYYLHNNDKPKAKIYFRKCKKYEKGSYILVEISNHFLKIL